MSIHGFDVVVLGAGPAGEVFAGQSAEAGFRVALVEQHLVAGECSYYACMPSKALLYPGEVLDEARRAPGVREAVTGGLDVSAVLERRDEVIHHLDDSSQLAWLRERGIELFRGSGVIAGEREVRVGGDVLVADRAVAIATGSSASIPPIPGLPEAPIWNNRQGTTASTAPESLIILGGGPVGCELAQAWSSLGSEVTIFEPEERVLVHEEPFAGDLVEQALWDRHGVTMVTGTAVESVSTTDSGITVSAGGKEYTAAELMVATGRRPRTDRIGLESIGVDGGAELETDDCYRVKGHDWLFAVGDVNGRAPLTHMGKYQAWVGVRALLGHEPENRAELIGSPRVTFTNPQVAAVGKTLAEAEAEGIDAVAIDADTGSTAGASFLGRGVDGKCRLVVDQATGLVVGATFVGFEVAEWLQAATVAIVGKVSMDELRHAVAPFPTRSEIWLRFSEEWEARR
ncbi:MAG TPA: NAD(P)/FAD-dependent oxidoreductase [Solirubrobacterales bacterium]|nr:NAD(P)/FAD-dependent oxidoreductase [Solirubrobacterales bacterium]HMY25694.1 NAD(P)/FAD-dependent oxidoreductase [Solirubrobacterales bacterium]HNA23553.1 NAD(P)/FAD-dependent oxidoreductase [Solirubrobacterales bacterium]HNA43465.1 NAD(P)/FAD-dependent oxidoreductase [Solirubrobacterales bacterium]HNC94026.1 NAD(P)/FAD-dependent oxidoreductase [Solirubrobacterales bacterium]